MIYNNPIINSDYSDPDIIKYKGSYYLVSSSFSDTPGVPILKSKNLVDWKILRYVYKNLPFIEFDNVRHGEGAWAPSIRYHNGIFYIIVPMYGKGIYVYQTDDIENGEFKFNKLIDNPGVIDPCPIWTNDDKCYLVCGFAKSKCGFNSVLGLYEVSCDLKENISSDYKIIFDGHNTQPTIEGPKIYYINKYYYILAPAGSVKSGWQVCLRSKNIYGPYEEKIVLLTNDVLSINGPHQGGLVKINKKDYAFIHFQDKGPQGRICHLEPVKWVNDWPIIGDCRDEMLGGSPVLSHEYLINKKSNYKIQVSDNFKSNKLSLMWQTPANIKDSWFKFDNGLVLNPYYNELGKTKLDLQPNLLLTKLYYNTFTVKTKLEFDLVDSKSDIGFTYMGMEYQYMRLIKIDDIVHLQLISGGFNKEEVILEDIKYDKKNVIFMMKYVDNSYMLGYNNNYFNYVFKATPGRWIGGKYGIFERGLSLDSKNYCKAKYFKVVEYAD